MTEAGGIVPSASSAERWFKKMLEDLLGSIFGYWMGKVILDFLLSLIAPLAIIVVVLVYLYHAFTWRQIGRKAGLEEEWMPFIPIARSIYRLKIVGDRPWKILFFMDSSVSWLVMTCIFSILSLLYWIFAIILAIGYFIFMFVVTIQYRIKYYRLFGMDTHLVLVSLIPGLNAINAVIDALLAYTKALDGKGAENKAGEQSAEQGRLTGITGEYSGVSLPVEDGQELVLGKDPAVCNIVLGKDSDFISHKHCGIRYIAASNTYILMDYSKNGVFDEQGNALHSNMQLYPGAVIVLANKGNMFRVG